MYNAQYMINAMHMASKQNQAKNKKMKKKANRFHPGILAAAALALATGCAGNDSTDEGSMQGNTTAAVRLTDFATAANPDASSRRMPTTRTSMDNHQYLTGGDFMWEPGDKIYVKDDDNTMQNSGTNSNITAKQATARFQLPGTYTASNTYEVRYTGTAATATADKVTIATAQTQTAPNDTKHFGASGDCGTATATRVGDHFEFMLDHKASYLCFLPRVTNAALGQNIYLTRIVVKSDNAIAGDYTLSLAGLSATPAANAAGEITLTTQGTDHPNGFPLTNTATSVATNAAYMVIAPGTHTLTVDYYIKDPVTFVEGFITKTLPAGKLFEANKVYDVTANLTPKDYSDRKYYMWDAQENYWYQHEWDAAEPWQPVLNLQSNSNYPQNNADIRWYNEISSVAQASHSCQACPNANEMAWYAMNGSPRWDDNQLWSTMSHLHKRGIWFKKKTKIPGFSDAHIPGSNTDLRTNFVFMQNTSITLGSPSASEIGDYFFLPALGYYYSGKQYDIGWTGNCWSSTTYHADGTLAIYLQFTNSNVNLNSYTRDRGFIPQTFE